jgi:hypothetical protein
LATVVTQQAGGLHVPSAGEAGQIAGNTFAGGLFGGVFAGGSAALGGGLAGGVAAIVSGNTSPVGIGASAIVSAIASAATPMIADILTTLLLGAGAETPVGLLIVGGVIASLLAPIVVEKVGDFLHDLWDRFWNWWEDPASADPLCPA